MLGAHLHELTLPVLRYHYRPRGMGSDACGMTPPFDFPNVSARFESIRYPSELVAADTSISPLRRVRAVHRNQDHLYRLLPIIRGQWKALCPGKGLMLGVHLH